MSAAALFGDALAAAIDAALGERLNGVFAGPAPKASAPYAEMGELIATDWSTKDRDGYELRSLVLIRDRGETPARVQALADAADAAIRSIDPALAGWRIASIALVRLRIVREGVGGWAALIEHRARLLADAV